MRPSNLLLFKVLFSKIIIMGTHPCGHVGLHEVGVNRGHYLHIIYPLSTQYLHTIYIVSTQ